MLLPIDLPSSIARLCLSPQGTRLALANEEGPGEVLVIELPSGKSVARYSSLGERPRMAFRSEAELLVVHEGDCWLCDITTNGYQILQLVKNPHCSGSLYCCRPSPDSKTVAMGGEIGGLLVLDLARADAPRLLPLPESGWIEGIDYSPDGQFVAIVIAPKDEDRAIRLIAVLDVRSGKQVRLLKLPWYQFYIYPTAFSPDNRVLAVGWQSRVLLYDLYPPKSPLDPDVLFGEDWTLHAIGWAAPMACHDFGKKQEVKNLWFSSEGIVLKILCEKGEALVVGVDEGKVLQETPTPFDQPDKVWGAEISAGGRAAVRVDGKTVLIWDVPGWRDA
jgi:WD40 repeat protein